MRSIGIIGAGQAGIVLAAELLRNGYRVNLYSDRSPQDYLSERARSAACLFGDQVAAERELGLAFWSGIAPEIERVHLDLCPEGLVALSVQAGLRLPAVAVDQRLKFAHGLRELQARGARVRIGTVDADQLDQIAGDHDLTVVTTGNRGLGRGLFERDAERSSRHRPRRNLFLLNLRGCDTTASPGQEHLKLSVVPGVLEVRWVPFYDRHVGSARSVLVGAVPGRAGDRFARVASATEGLAVLRELVREVLPWEEAFLAPAEPAHAEGWHRGSVVPTVRRAVATLPSGRQVLGLGDTVVVNDPLANQGANSAVRMARFLAERILEHGNGSFDGEWMGAQFDRYWEYGQTVNAFSEALLEPLSGFRQDLLIAASHHPRIGTDLFEGFNDPGRVYPWLAEPSAARAFLAEHGVGGGRRLGYRLRQVGRVLGRRLSVRAGGGQPL